MKKILLIFNAIIIISISSYAQVGIGSVPQLGSILDLTNSNNKYLILPVANSDPTLILVDPASVLYYNDKIYIKTSTGFKVMTPWEWDGSTTGAISSPANSPVGIGIIPTTGAPFRLQVANSPSDVSNTGSYASIVVGEVNVNPSCPHLLIDNNEIMAKSNASNAGVLKLQEEDGTVEVRSSGSDAGVNTVLTAYGSVDAKGKIKENGKDLLPVGAIIMWSGTDLPDGWALCDGGTYPLEAGGSVVTPNLLDRFIVAADDTNEGTGSASGSYTVTNTGGTNNVTLTITEIPSHTHSNTVSSDTHSHGLRIDTGGGGSGCTGLTAEFFSGDCAATNNTSNTAINGDTHNHTVTLGNTGLGGSHENRPPYFALAFIMKL